MWILLHFTEWLSWLGQLRSVFKVVPNQNDIGNRLWFGIIEVAIIFNAICLLLMNYTLSVLVRHLTVSSVIAAWKYADTCMFTELKLRECWVSVHFLQKPCWFAIPFREFSKKYVSRLRTRVFFIKILKLLSCRIAIPFKRKN